MPKGRWKQRLPNNPITFKSHYDTDSTVHYPTVGEYQSKKGKFSLTYYGNDFFCRKTSW